MCATARVFSGCRFSRDKPHPSAAAGKIIVLAEMSKASHGSWKKGAKGMDKGSMGEIGESMGWAK